MSGSTLFHALPGVANIDAMLKQQFGTGLLTGENPASGDFSHLIMAVAVVLFVIFLAIRYAGIRAKAENPMLPEANLNARSVVEIISEATFGMMDGVMGKEAAKFFFPLIGTLAFFILFSNLAGLIPGLLPPTDKLSTTIAPALIVFFATHIYGVKKNGIEHFKHMCGPMLVLAPLILVIELISHCVRPISLALRLFGNMVGDHMVLGIFLGLVPWIVPIPIMVLGTIVCVVQTLVFCLLSVVYISLAIEDLSHGHDDHAGEAHAH